MRLGADFGSRVTKFFNTVKTGKSRTFVKILYSGVRSLYGFDGATASVSDWMCAGWVVWNGI